MRPIVWGAPKVISVNIYHPLGPNMCPYMGGGGELLQKLFWLSLGSNLKHQMTYSKKKNLYLQYKIIQKELVPLI